MAEHIKKVAANKTVDEPSGIRDVMNIEGAHNPAKGKKSAAS